MSSEPEVWFVTVQRPTGSVRFLSEDEAGARQYAADRPDGEATVELIPLGEALERFGK